MLWKKKPQEKPNKIKIDLAFDRCKDSVQELLDQYQGTIDNYLAKMVSLKREGRTTEANRYKQKLKLVLSRQAKMNDLMDQIEQFNYMVDEAFAKSAVYDALGTVIGETNKINMSPEIKKMLKQVNEFDDIFSKGLSQMDAIFGKVSSKISDIDNDMSGVQDQEIDAIVSMRLEQYDQQTTLEAEANSDLFRLN